MTDLQNGFYTCMARNKVGKTHKTTEVKILGELQFIYNSIRLLSFLESLGFF